MHLSKAAELDPFSIVGLFYISAGYYRTNFMDKAGEYAKRIIALEDNFSYGHLMLGAVSWMTNNDIENLIKETERAVQLEGNLTNYGYLAGVYAIAGQHDKAREILQIMDKLSGDRSMGIAKYGFVYSCLSEFDEAFKYFNRAVDRREGLILDLAFRLDMEFPALKNDPRLAALRDRIGLPR